MTTITADYFRSPVLPSQSFSATGGESYLQDKEAIASGAASSLQSQAFANLAQIARDCAKEGWDGYNAKPITSATINRVRTFLGDLPPWMPAPDIVPEADGEIAIEWFFAKDQTFSVSIGEQGPLHYAGLFGRNEETYGVASYFGSVPAKIFQLISDLLRCPAARRSS